MLILIGKNSSNTTHVMSGQRKLSIWSATLPKREKFLIGNQKFDSMSLCASWSTPIWNCFRAKRRENISENCRKSRTGFVPSVRVDDTEIFPATESQTEPDLFRPSNWPRRDGGRR